MTGGIKSDLNYLMVLHVIFAPSIEILIIHSVVGLVYFVVGVLCIVLSTDEDLATMARKEDRILDIAPCFIILMICVLFCLSANGFLYYVGWGFGLSVMSYGFMTNIENNVGTTGKQRILDTYAGKFIGLLLFLSAR